MICQRRAAQRGSTRKKENEEKVSFSQGIVKTDQIIIFSAKATLSADDIDYLKKNTRYDEQEIKEWYRCVNKYQICLNQSKLPKNISKSLFAEL